MTPLPDKDLQPKEVDQIIKDHAKPLPEGRKAALMEKLRGERDRFDLSKSQEASKGNDRSNER